MTATPARIRPDATVADTSQRLLRLADKAKALGTAEGLEAARLAIMEVARLNGVDRTELIGHLDEIRAIAREQKQPAAAVAATMAQAHVLGLLVDRSDVAIDVRITGLELDEAELELVRALSGKTREGADDRA